MTETKKYTITSEDALFHALMGNLEDYSTNDIVALWNDFCESVQYYEDIIYYVEELNDILAGKKPLEIIDMLAPSFDSRDTYCCLNNHGWLVSFEYWEQKNSPICLEDMVKYMVDSKDNLGDGDSEGLINEYLEYLDSENEEND